MMESRKRPHSTEDEPAIQKKRILTGVNGSPHVNAVVSETDEPKEGDDLEVTIVCMLVTSNGSLYVLLALSKRSHISENEALFQRTRAQSDADSRVGEAKEHL